MFEGDLDALPTRDLLERAAGCRATANRSDAELLECAQLYADRFHPSVCQPRPGRPSPDGGERAVVLGGDGCPEIAEFCIAEFSVVIGVSPGVGRDLIADALALRHRFPRTWARIQRGEATPWKARQIVRACTKLDQPGAAYVDDIVDTISPYRLDKIIQAAKMTADPAGARKEAAEDADERGVFIGRTKHGTKTIYIKAPAAAVNRFDAAITTIADALKTFGDTRNLQHRRADAIGILPDSHYTQELLTQARTHTQRAHHPTNPSTANEPSTQPEADTGNNTGTEPDTDADTGPSMDADAGTGTGPGTDTDTGPGMDAGADAGLDTGTGPGTDLCAGPEPQASRDGGTGRRPQATATFDPIAAPDVTATSDPTATPDVTAAPDLTGGTDVTGTPGLTDSPDPTGTPDLDDLVELVELVEPPGPPDDPWLEAAGPSDPDPVADPFDQRATADLPDPRSEPDQGSPMDAAALRALDARLAQIKHDAYTDPSSPAHRTKAQVRPGQTEVVVHLTDHTLATGTGVLRAETIGPLLATQLTELIGHGPYTVKPVIDLNDAVSVNAYEIPPRIRERVKLMYPVELFPYGTRETSNTIDLDHIEPYDPLGPPGQTSTTNLAPLSRFGHRIKTHARGWTVRRIDHKTLEWTTPHGFTFHVDPDGTHRGHPSTPPSPGQGGN